MGAYATRDDVYLIGLSAQAFVTRPRPLESYVLNDFNPATGIIRLVGNGFSSDDLVYLTVTPGGALPGGSAALTYYSPLPLGGDLFKLAATPGGTALTFTTAGSGWALAIDPLRRLDVHLEQAAAEIDEDLTAHEPPILRDPITGKFPQVLVGMNARTAARSAVTSLQIENAAYRKAVDRLLAQEAHDLATRADWKAGKPIQPRPTDQNELPDNAARAYSLPAVPWITGRL